MSAHVLFRVRLKLTAPLATELASGTLFGMLCWARRETESDAALTAWLQEPESLWAVSDGFPADHLPRPVLLPAPASAEGQGDKAKKIKKCSLVTRRGFLESRSRLTHATLGAHLRRPADTTVSRAHNTIDRRTGTTPQEGGLYFMTEDWRYNSHARTYIAQDTDHCEVTIVPGAEHDIYVTAPDTAQAEIECLFAHMGQSGYGRDATYGRGRFDVCGVEMDAELGDFAGDRVMSLSRGAAPGLADLRCKLRTHYGRIGAMAALDGTSPFKKPLLLTEPGATFRAPEYGRAGAWLTGVHPTRPEIGHNAYHVTIGYREGGDA